MKKIFLALSLLVQGGLSYFAQTTSFSNLVPNPSFEEGWNIRPTNHSQMEWCDDWTNRINTPDWYKETGDFFSSTYVDPHTGNCFAGISGSEGIQVKLNDPLQGHKFVTVSFWFSLEGGTDDFEFNIIVDQDKADADNEEFDPSAIGSSTGFRQTYTVSSSNYEQGAWHLFQSEPFLYTPSRLSDGLFYSDALEENDWLIITGSGVGSNYCYIDDVELTQFSPCFHTCVDDTGPLRIQAMEAGPAFQEEPGLFYPSEGVIVTNINEDGSDNELVIDAAVGNSQDEAFFYVMENAVRVVFTVVASNDQIMWYQDNYDYNGLKDEGFNDFAVIWNGRTLGGGTIPQGAYIYYLEVYSCGIPKVTIQSSLIMAVASPPAQQSNPNYQNTTINPCCEENYVFQNYTFENTVVGFDRKDAYDFILAGADVDNNLPSGNVIVENGAKVAFYAENNITLEPGFIVQSGGRFISKLSPCGAIPRSNSIRTFASENLNTKETGLVRASIGNRGTHLGNENVVSVFPSPTRDFLTINSMSLVTELAVFSITGAEMMNFKEVSKKISINVGTLSSGQYLIKILTIDGTQVIPFIKM